MGKKDDYTTALLEDIRGDIKAILEIVVPTREEVAIIKEDVTVLKDDVKVIKAVAIKTNQNIAEHDDRIRQLKTRTV